ncbi:MAG: ABC transporter ATP-binding protein [Burkholderiaceae bacterium]
MTPATTQASVAVRSVDINYVRGGQVTSAVRDVSFEVGDNEFIALVGPSGCGKTTLLHAIGGLVGISAGDIVCASQHSADGLDRVMVFQEQSLLKWRTVEQNVAFALECKRVPKAERAPVIEGLLRQVGLWHRKDAYPFQLSGGMKQRVAIARALASGAPVLLMDEPFGALDAQTRLSMQTFLLKLWQESKKTVIFVTHDIDEAIYLADRVLVMSAGPGTIRASIPVELPRPRPSDAHLSDEFIASKRRILAEIRSSETDSAGQADH